MLNRLLSLLAVLLLGVLSGLAWGESFPLGREPSQAGKQGPADPTASSRLPRSAGRGTALRFSTGKRVNCAAFSPDGGLLATGGEDSAIRFWDVATGKEVRTLPGRGVHSLAFSADGTRLASAGEGGTVRLWDVRTGKQLRKWKGSELPQMGVGFAPDGKTVASGDWGEELYLWEVATGKRLRRTGPGESPTEWVAFSPDLRLAAQVTTSGVVTVRETASGRSLYAFHPDGLVRWHVANFSPDGRFLALGGSHTLDLFDLRRAERVWRHHDPELRNALRRLAFSADGKLLASADAPGSMTLWDAATGQPIRGFAGHPAAPGFAPPWVLTLAFSPDGRRLASGAENGTVLVRDVPALVLDAGLPPVGLSETQIRGCWEDLGAVDIPRAYRAVYRLAARGGDPAVAFLGTRLRPVTGEEMTRAARLIADLDHRSFTVREKATQELEKLGEQALPALERALEKNRPLEVRRRIARLQDRVAGGRERAARAVLVLEQVGTSGAQEVLRRVAAGAAQARLTQQAQAALGRLAMRRQP
jgi:hypothetical protein